MGVVGTLAVVICDNPHPAGSREHDALRLFRFGLALAPWSAGFGLIGVALALTAFVMVLRGIIQGRTPYGVAVLVLRWSRR